MHILLFNTKKLEMIILMGMQDKHLLKLNNINNYALKVIY